jgi:hypothetical protein
MGNEGHREEDADGRDETILRLRLATLRRNLEQVRHTEGSVAQRREEIRALADVFDQAEGIQTKARYVVEGIDEAMQRVIDLQQLASVPKTIVDRLKIRLTEAASDATQVTEHAQRSASVIKAMSQRWSRLSADDLLDTHIREIFAEQAKNLVTAIDKLRTNSPDAAWSTYQQTIRGASEDLFSEYVEFLSGLALRDTGLGGPLTVAAAANEHDHGNGAIEQLGPDVYMMADDLVKQIYRIGEADLWHSLTIPARRDAAARTVARMIRLGFPEWTIWAVPLSAYEFGRVVIDRKKAEIVDRYAAANGAVGQGLEIVLADAFATYALGPAYAYASVYVLLDPGTAARRANGEGAAAAGPACGDSERAFVVFRMLELMDEGGALTAVINELRRRWMMAVRQAKGTELPDAAEAEPLERLTSHLWNFLRHNAPRIQYSARRWSAVIKWDPLAILVGQEWRLAPGREDVRDILNAAWHQRLATKPDSTPDPVTDQELADAALELWRRDLASRRKSSQPRGF